MLSMPILQTARHMCPVGTCAWHTQWRYLTQKPLVFRYAAYRRLKALAMWHAVCFGAQHAAGVCLHTSLNSMRQLTSLDGGEADLPRLSGLRSRLRSLKSSLPPGRGPPRPLSSLLSSSTLSFLLYRPKRAFRKSLQLHSMHGKCLITICKHTLQG